MESFRDSSNPLRQPWSGLRHRASDFWQKFLCQRSGRLGYDRQQLARRHADQREKVLCGFVFRFSLRRKLSEVLHHGIGINLAHGIELELVFEFMLVLMLHLVFHFLFAEQVPDHVSDGAEPAFAFQARFVFHFFFHLLFKLMLVFGMGF
jgi:hypothetical protein